MRPPRPIKTIEEKYKSPTLQDIIKYENRARRLQSEAFYISYKKFKSWLFKRLNNKSIK